MKLLFTAVVAALATFHCLGQAKINAYTYGAMEARWLGPGTMSGRITAIEGVNSDGRTLYVGTAGGGIWKSTNAGASFKPIFDKYCMSIGCLAIDQANPATILVGTGESNMRNSVSVGDGIYKTTDGGDNWVKTGLDSTEHIAKIIIDPKNSNNIYVAVPGPLWGNSKHRGVYKSTDGGDTWTKVFYINEQTGCADIAVDPTNPDVVFATMWEFRRYPYAFNSGGTHSGMYKSTDGGKTWRELTEGLPKKPFGRIALTLAPSSPKDMIAIVESKETGLFISADGGEHWKSQSATLNVVSRPFYFSCLVIDPKDPKRVYRPGYGFSYSNDGGYSFSDASYDGGWVHSDHHALWINPNYTNQMYLGTDGGVYYSLDRGATWMFVYNLPVGQFYHVACDSNKPYRVFGGLQDNGSWMAPSAAPGGVINSSWQSLYGGDGFWVQPDPTDPNTVYAESQGGNMGRIDLTNYKSLDITPLKGAGEEKLRWNWNTPIVTGQANKHNLYTAAQYLYKTTDQGRTWQRISPDLSTNDKRKQEQENSGGLSEDNTSAENHCTIFAINESPLNEKMIWVGTDDGNLQLTTDGGTTWTNVAKNYAAAGIPAQTWVSSIEPSRFDKNVVYATFDNHMYGDMKTYVAKSSDAGKTWKLLNSAEFTGFAHKIKEDLVNPNLLFLGTEAGLFASVDGGENWFRMKNHIPDYCIVRDIQIQPQANDLVLATHGRGIMIVEDITPMRIISKQIAQNEVVMFDAKPIPLRNGVYGGGGSPVSGGWYGGNPDDLPPIVYYLKDRANGEVKVNIYDAQGKLVQSLPGSRRKGINKVYWNLRCTPPKTATGGSKMDNGGFMAPMVPPGTYTAKLKLGDKEYVTPLTLVHDTANHQFSLADRQVQYKAAMDLYHLHEQLKVLVDKINADQQMLKDNMDSIANPKQKKVLQDYFNKLETLRATLLATKHKSIFADEKKLREEITELYATMCYIEARPANLQLARVTSLTAEEQEAEKSYQQITTAYKEKADKAIATGKPKPAASGARLSN
ncbi:MAG: glycosyl hydrolase [Chitinophagia bacterium]|nr:glycosyl hydrolase [Chitinophagia bacterium]